MPVTSLKFKRALSRGSLGRTARVDADEQTKQRARGIEKLGKLYEAGGGSYDDTGPYRPAEESLDAVKDYDLMSRIRPSLKNRMFKKR